ncbi:MAG: response regulator [Candidatus Omnitrophica bacterium]|nr:response regulator [Candidatus Omnitrophota bacterium]
MLRILVVDDNMANRQFLVELLSEKAQCECASGGRAAVQAYQASITEKEPFDLILLDIAMPEVDGLEVLGAIRETEKKAGVTLGEGLPIIMATAHEQPFMKAFNSGCDDYVLKPIDPDELFRKIDNVLKARGRLR